MLISKSWPALLLLTSLAAHAAPPRLDLDAYRSLASDRRAYEVGDVLTVVVVESTTAESAAGTAANSTTGISANAGVSGTGNAHAYAVNMAVAGDSSGTGQTSRRGQVRTRVAVQVIGKTGDLLRVKGEQIVTVNDEKQTVRITGLIRPDDIAGDNTVLSSRLADANIEIAGNGAVTQAQRQNIIFRFLKWIRVI